MNILKKSNSIIFKQKDYQCGFTESKSTIHNIYKILKIIKNERYKRNGKMGFIFVDFKKAFDSICR